MTATVTKLAARVRAAIDAFLDSPKIAGNPHTLRAYTNVLDRIADRLDPDRALAELADAEIGDALTALWSETKPATWNCNRAAVGSWLTWCAAKQHQSPTSRCWWLRRPGKLS